MKDNDELEKMIDAAVARHMRDDDCSDDGCDDRDRLIKALGDKSRDVKDILKDFGY